MLNILRRCLNGRDHVFTYYDDETQTLQGANVVERTCGQLYKSDVREWLGRDAMMRSPVLEGTDLYLQIVGNLLYRVTSKDDYPYAQVSNEAFTEFSLSYEKIDVSSYDGSDGAYTITINDGSGYFQMLIFEGIIGNYRTPVLQKENLKAGTYTITVRDRLTAQEKNLDIVIDQSAAADSNCLSLDGIEIQKASSSTAADGQITVYASGPAQMEYKLDAGGVWQDSSVFSGLSKGYYTVYVRDKLDTSCEKRQNVLLDYEEEINVSVIRQWDVACYSKANGIYEFTVGPGISGYYTYLWSDGSTKGSRYDLSAGDYQLTITTGRGTTKILDITIGISAYAGPWDVEITIDRNNVYVDPKGQTLWYEWEDGVTEGSRENLPRGEYILKIGGDQADLSCYQSYRIVIEGERHFFADNPVPLRLRANNLGVKKDLSFVAAVYLEQEYGSGVFEQVGPVSMEQPADENGETLFFLETILQSYLEPALPDPLQVDIRLMDSQFKRFYLAHYEKFGDPPTIYDFTIVQIHYVLSGGLNKIEVAADDFFDVYLPEQRPFYSWQPAVKEVFTDQPEFLYYVVNEDGLAQFQVWIRLYFEDYTTLEDNLFSVANPSRYELYRFPTGYKQLRLSDYETAGKKITYYEIWVSDGLFVPLSETRQYNIQRVKPERVRYFFYLNSLGCFETLATTGYGGYSMKVSYDTFEPTERRVLTLQEIGSQVISKAGQEEVRVPVGFPSPILRLALKDFALSSQVYLYQSGRVIPLETEVDGSEYLDELEPLGDITILYRLPNDSKYTPDMAARKPITSAPLIVNLVAKTLVQNGNDGAISIEVIGGIPPYTFLWNNGETTQNLVGLPVGTYSVSVQDSGVPPTGDPKSFGRLHNIVLYEQPISDVEYFGQGSFEDYTTESFNELFEFSAPYGMLEVSTAQKRTGSKSLKLSVVPDAPSLPGDTFIIPKAVGGTDVYIGADSRYKASMWIYIPSSVVLRPSVSGYDGSKMGLYLSAGSYSDYTVEAVTRANCNLRDTWQYMETILTPNTDWGGTTRRLYIEMGYASTSGTARVAKGIWEQDTYLYIDDFKIDKIPL